MKKIILSIISIACLAGLTNAQNFKKIFYKENILENIAYKVTISDVVATPTGLKFKLTIDNKSKDYIIYKPNESTFKIDGKEYKPDEKPIIIRPSESDYRVVNLPGPNYMITKDFEFTLNGIYKSLIDVGSISATNIKLPPKEDDFKNGDFSFKFTKFVNDTKHTDVKFTVKYSGDKTGIYEPRKVNMTMKSGKENPNYFSTKNPQVFSKGDELEIGIAWKNIPESAGNMAADAMTVIWKDAFLETTPEKVSPQKINIFFDGERTDDPKNKK